MKYIFITCGILFFGCSDEIENKYIGTWSNTYLGNGADLEIIVKKADDNLYVEERIASTHTVIERASAKVQNGYLVIEGNRLFPFTKVAYSTEQDALVPLEGPLNMIPPFKRVHN